MSVKLLTEHHFEFLRLKGGCTSLPQSTLVKMPHGWKSHVATHSTLTACDGLTEIRELQGLPEPVNAATPNPALEKVRLCHVVICNN